MKLTLKERFIIIHMLPNEGNYATMTIKEDLFVKMKLKQEEIESLGVKEEDGAIKWDGTKDTGNEYELSELELKMVKDQLNMLDNSRKLNDDTMIIYRKFN